MSHDVHSLDLPLDLPGRAYSCRVTFESVAEDAPGAVWQRMFDQSWPAWSRWFNRPRTAPGPDLRMAERALRRHMPEIAPVWQRLVELAGGAEDAARFLTFWSPPRYLAHCSLAVLEDRDGPALIRNYDLDPTVSEGRLFKSVWLDRGVIGMAEGIAGLADGMNSAGLALALAFGGRPAIGRGFGIPLILRYVLEFCADVADAVEALRAVPCHMSYNVALIDRAGHHATVMLAPDRPAIVTRARCATNHQLGVEWPGHARLSQTVEREGALTAALERGLDAPALNRLFLKPPIHSRRYGAGFGTVYTALYRPAAGTVDLSWPGLTPWRQGFDGFADGARRITFSEGNLPLETPDHADPTVAVAPRQHPDDAAEARRRNQPRPRPGQ